VRYIDEPGTPGPAGRMGPRDVARARCLECRTVALVALLGDSAICEACLRAGLLALDGAAACADEGDRAEGGGAETGERCGPTRPQPAPTGVGQWRPRDPVTGRLLPARGPA